MHDTVAIGSRHFVWLTTVKASVVEDIGQSAWDAADVSVRRKFKHEGMSQRHTVIIAAILEEL